jgi:hypothetical protein
MKGILEVIKLIYGSKALSKILGTRTNVIRLPDNELKQYTKSDLNIEAASDKLAQKAKADMKELLADYPRMNDAEKLIFEGNLRRLGNKLGVTEKGSAADVLEFGTGEKVSPEGIMSLTEKAGQKNPPTTLMGKLESRIKQLEASGEDLSKLKGKTYDEFMKDITQGQKSMRKLEDEGLVRATAREIIGRDIKSGKIKLPKEIEQDIVQGGGEPINVFRQFYGEDALEQLDSMIPEFKNMYSPREAADAATKKFKFEFKADRPPGSISIEDAKKTEQEFNIIPADSEEGKIITEKLIGKPKAPVTELMTAEKIISDMKKMDPMDAMKEANKVLKKEGKYKNLQEKDVERIMEDTNDFIFGRDIPEDPEGFAKGGRVGFNEGSKLTDYLKTNISAKTSSSSPEEGVKVKQEILDGIISLNIPLSKKLKLLGDLKFGKNRAKVDLSELGKKYGIDLGEEVYKDKYFSPGLGAEYTTDEGTKFNLMVNPEDKGGSISVSRSFANGGSTGLDYLMGIERRGYANGNIASGLAIRLNRPVQPGDPIGSYYGGTPIMISNKKVEPTLNRDSQGRLVNSITGKPITTPIFLPLNRELMSSPSKPSMTLRDKLRPLSLNERLQFFATNKPSYDEFYDLLQMNLKGEDRQQAADGGSQGLDYLMGIERRGYANGDYVVQAGIKNYLGKQKTATVPIKWKSGKGDSHPDTELAYITKPEKDLLIKLDMHNSMPDGEPNIGPGGLISLNSGGDGGAGGGGGGDGGSTDTGDQGSEAANDAASASAAASASGSSGTDTADMGSEAANVSSTSSGAASVGSGSSGTDTADMGSEAANVSSTSSGAASVGAGDSGGPTDTADMGSEAANVSSTQSGAASVGAGDSGGPTDTADLGTEAANDAATAAAAASVGMGTLSSYSRPGMVATNISNYMRGNPMTSLGLTALGTMIGVPALGVMNAVNSVYGGGSSGSSTGSGQGEDGSGDGGDEEDERTPISSFDSALLTPDLLDSYNLAKNRDYRLFQSSNNPFYSLQRNPSGGINNVYTEFKKGGRVGFAEGGSMSKGLDYLSGVERRGYVGGGFGSGLVDPMEAMYVNTFGFNPFPKYGFNSYMDYNTARITGTPMNQNISDLEDYLGTLESAREINLPGVTKDLSAEDISRLQEEYVKKMAKTSNALNPTVTASTAASTPDYRQQALSEMLSRYNVSSLGDIKNFNYLIPGYKDKNNLEVRAFETRIPDLAVSRRAQQLEDAAIRAQQDQEAYKNRISQVDPNALRNSYLQNLQNTSSQSIDQFQSKLRSNLVPRKQAAQGLNYLTGL